MSETAANQGSPSREETVELLSALLFADVGKIKSIAAKAQDFDAWMGAALDFVSNEETFPDASQLWDKRGIDGIYQRPARGTVALLIFAPRRGWEWEMEKNRKICRPNAEAFRAALECGWKPGSEELVHVLSSEARYVTPDYLAAAVESGALLGAFAQLPSLTILFALGSVGDSVEALDLLDKMSAAGLLDPKTAQIGPADLLGLGMPECAKRLDAFGFELGPVKVLERYVAVNLPPVAAMAMHAGSAAFKGGYGDARALEVRWDEALASTLEAIRWLKEKGANFDCGTKEGFWMDNPFCAALLEAGEQNWERHATVVKALAEAGADPNQAGHSFLAWAVGREGWLRNDSALRLAMEVGADAKGAAGPVLAALSSLGADPKTAIARCSAMLADPKLKIDLSEIGAGGELEDHPVARAASRGHAKLAKHLASLGFPAAWTNAGETILHHLARQAGKASLELLSDFLARPEFLAQIDFQTQSELKGEGAGTILGSAQGTALMAACGAANVAAAEILLRAGAQPNLADAKGWTAMHHLSRKFGEKSKSKILPLIELLLDNGANFAAPDAAGRTPLQLLAKKSPISAVARLAKLHGAEVLGDGPLAKDTAQSLERRATNPAYGKAPDRHEAEELLIELELDKGALESGTAEAPKPAPRRPKSL